MPSLSDLLWGVFMPACLGLAAGLLTSCPCIRERHRRWLGIGVALTAVGAAAAWWAMWTWGGWWPISQYNRQPVILAALGLGLAVGQIGPRSVSTMVTLLAGPAVFASLAMKTEDWWQLMSLGLVISILGLATDRAIARRQTRSSAFTLVTILGLAAPLFVLLASAKQGQATGFIAAAIGGVSVASLFYGRLAPLVATWGLLSLSLMASNDVYFGDRSLPWVWVILAASVAMISINHLPFFERKPWRLFCIRSCIIAILISIAAALTWQALKPTDNSNSTDSSSSPYEVDYGGYGK